MLISQFKRHLFAVTGMALAMVFFIPTVASAAGAIIVITQPIVSSQDNAEFTQGQTTPQFSITSTLKEGDGGSLPFWRAYFSATTDFLVWQIPASVTPQMCAFSTSMAANCVSITIDGAAPSGTTTVSKIGTSIDIRLDGNINNTTNLIPMTSTPKTVVVTFAAGMFSIPSYKGSVLQSTYCDVGNNCPSVNPVQVQTVGTNTLSFNSNGGAGTMPDSTQTGTHALPSNTFTKPGSEFAGWATSSTNANRQIIAYTDGASFEYGGSNITLYAVWRVPGSSSNSESLLAQTSGPDTYLPLGLLSTFLLSLGVVSLIASYRRSRIFQ